MKYKVILAALFFFPAFVGVIDWFIFSNRKENLTLDYEELKLRYANHFPEFMRPITENTLVYILILFMLFLIAGFIFIYIKNRFCVALGIVSFSLAALQLWWLM